MDIEINGEPIEDLHMKLGEAGEAFFVHETQDEAEVSSTPLPPYSLFVR